MQNGKENLIWHEKKTVRLEISTNHGTVEISAEAEASSAVAHLAKEQPDAETGQFAWIGEQPRF